MGMNEPQQKQVTWFDQLEKLRAILNEGHAIASEIIGSEVEEDGSDNRNPSCYIERLDDELAQVLSSAQYLVSRLRNINAAF